MVFVDHAGLCRQDRSIENLGDAQLDIVFDSSQWEEEVKRIGNTDITKEDLLGWHDNLEVKTGGFLHEGHLSDGLVRSRFKVNILNSAGNKKK